METIHIDRRRDLPHGWEFSVRLGANDRTHLIMLDRGTWEELSHGRHSPEEIIRQSLAFLIEKEPAESILPSFNILEIPGSFPDFFSAIERRLS